MRNREKMKMDRDYNLKPIKTDEDIIGSNKKRLTIFQFFKNTPLTDLKNTIYFKSNEKRDDFFNRQYNSVAVTNSFTKLIKIITNK